MLGLAAVFAAVPALPAQAHSGLVSSSPADRVVLQSAPETAELTFNESIRPVVSAFQLYDPSGAKQQVDVTAVDRVARVSLPAGLADGSYVLSWRVISADSHPIAGAVSFSVGQPSNGTPAAGTERVVDGRVVPAYLVAQILALSGLLAAVGLTLFQVLVLRSETRAARARERVHVAAVVVTIVGHAALLPLTLARGEGLTLGRLVEPTLLLSTLGSAPALALALVVLGCAAMLLLPVVPGRRTHAVLGGLGAALALTSVLPVGHTRTTAPVAVVMGADVIHTLAGAVWFGGVIGLGIYLAAARRAGTPAGEAAVAVRRFSGLAGCVVVALGVTGLVLGVLILGSVSALIETNYGRTLLVKLGFVAVIGLLAVWNKSYLVPAVERPQAPREQWRRLTGAVRDEIALLVAVICVTGLLVMQSPVEADSSRSPAPVASDFRAALGAGTVQGSIKPVRVGSNEFEFVVRGADGGSLSPLETPKVTVALPEAGLGPLVASVRRAGKTSDRYIAELTLPTSGPWQVSVAVRVDTFSNLTARQVISVRE